jgi:L-threonylcarbamoyladenylate synthase
MQTHLLSTDSEHYESSLQTASDLIKHGKIIAFPTETVYGLGASIWNEQQIKKIYQAKGRPSDNPIIAHIAKVEDVYSLAELVTDDSYKLMEIFFPGALTLVLKRKSVVPSIVSAGLDTIAVRMPNHEIALDLIQRSGSPLVAPSANTSGSPSPTTAQHVMNDLSGKISAILDGGDCGIGIESTVIDMTTSSPVILRPGSITAQMISDVLQKQVIHAGKTSSVTHSPGVKYRHYAPKARVVVLNEKERHLFRDSTQLILHPEPQNLSVETTSELEIRLLHQSTFYNELRRADALGYTTILIILPDKFEANNEGLYNRIKKSAEVNDTNP